MTLLWAGVKKLKWSTPVSALLSVLDLVGLTALVISLGWLGLGIFLLANAVAFIASGAAGSIYVDAELATAAAHSSSFEKDDMRGLFRPSNPIRG